jgi:hypothetical protein
LSSSAEKLTDETRADLAAKLCEVEGLLGSMLQTVVDGPGVLMLTEDQAELLESVIESYGPTADAADRVEIRSVQRMIRAVLGPVRRLRSRPVVVRRPTLARRRSPRARRSRATGPPSSDDGPSEPPPPAAESYRLLDSAPASRRPRRSVPHLTSSRRGRPHESGHPELRLGVAAVPHASAPWPEVFMHRRVPAQHLEEPRLPESCRFACSRRLAAVVAAHAKERTTGSGETPRARRLAAEAAALRRKLAGTARCELPECLYCLYIAEGC